MFIYRSGDCKDSRKEPTTRWRRVRVIGGVGEGEESSGYVYIYIYIYIYNNIFFKGKTIRGMACVEGRVSAYRWTRHPLRCRRPFGRPPARPPAVAWPRRDSVGAVLYRQPGRPASRAGNRANVRHQFTGHSRTARYCSHSRRSLSLCVGRHTTTETRSRTGIICSYSYYLQYKTRSFAFRFC